MRWNEMKRLLLFFSMFFFLFTVASGQTCDPSGDCGGDTIPGNYDVLSPMGQSAVEMIEMADRLETLEGKTIALVGGSFMASVSWPA